MPTAVNSANSLINLIYRAVAWANLADNASASPATVLDIALHTAAPVTNLQSSNEATYISYTRVAVARPAGWAAAASGSTNNLALIQFPQCTGGTNTITHISVGVGGGIIHFGALVAPVSVSNTIQPQFSASTLVVIQT